jgi:bacteriorhodopsin
VVFVIMLAASAIFSFLSWSIPVSRRLYHVITTLITITAALSYFAMATGAGVSYHCVRATDYHDHIPDTHHPVCRQVFWARYVDWTITTPLLLLDLALLAGIDGAHTLMAIVADLIMILTGLFAAFGQDRGRGSAQKWGWYTIGCVAYIFVVWHIGLHGSRVVTAKGKTVTRLFASLAAFTFILWTAYPM